MYLLGKIAGVLAQQSFHRFCQPADRFCENYSPSGRKIQALPDGHNSPQLSIMQVALMTGRRAARSKNRQVIAGCPLS
jgi:hypothetical protein